MREEVIVESYQVNHKLLTLDLAKENIEDYNMTLTLAAWLELRKGMKATKTNKPTKTGTKVTYTRLSNEELEGYMQDFISKNKPTFIAWLIKKGYAKEGELC